MRAVDEGSGVRVVIRPPLWWRVGLGVFAVVVVVMGARNLRPLEIACSLVIGVACAAMARVSVVASPTGLTIRNVGRRVEVPWSRVEGFAAIGGCLGVITAGRREAPVLMDASRSASLSERSRRATMQRHLGLLLTARPDAQTGR